MSTSDIVIAISGIVFFIWSTFSMLRPMILQAYSCCFTVELFPNYLVGCTIFGKKRLVVYGNIEKIVTVKRYWFLRANILLVGSDGAELEIHHNIDYLGKCVEEIRQRSPNIKEVAYNGMDRIPEVWAAGDKHCML